MEQPEVITSPTKQAKDETSNTPPTTTTNNNDPKKEQVTVTLVGSHREDACIFLLDGMEESEGKKERVTVAIDKLPAVLGRTHETNDPHFFGLGKKKALSRNHCKIYYRDIQGGCVEWNHKTSKLEYDDKKKHEKSNLIGKLDALPQRGFFVIECMGKNRILVNGERVEQGQAMVLKQNTAIRISTYTLYFLLPLDATSTEHVVVMESSPKKSKPREHPSSSTTSGGPAAKKAKTVASSGGLQSELDQLSTDILLEMMDKAFESGLWERKDQLIGSTIALRAVVSAAEAPEIQEPAIKKPGVSRTDIMEWIEKSEKYSSWSKQMLAKMEHRSYVASITKSLLKAGWTRTSGAGRYVKWELPIDTKMIVNIDNLKERKDADEGGVKTADDKVKIDDQHNDEKGSGIEAKIEKEPASVGGTTENTEDTQEQISADANIGVAP